MTCERLDQELRFLSLGLLLHLKEFRVLEKKKIQDFIRKKKSIYNCETEILSSTFTTELKQT